MQSTAKTTSSRLLEYFDGWTIRKGEDYFWRGKVLRQALRQDTELWGRISGSFENTYESTVYFEDASRAKVVETDCSCPLRADCKHTVALLLAHLMQNNSTPNGAAGKSHSTAAPSMEVSKSSISTAANRANWRPALRRLGGVQQFCLSAPSAARAPRGSSCSSGGLKTKPERSTAGSEKAA